MSELLDADVFQRIEYVRALDVPPDAVLAVKSSRKMTVEQAEAIMEQVSQALPGRKVLVLPPELDLVVVRDVT